MGKIPPIILMVKSNQRVYGQMVKNITFGHGIIKMDNLYEELSFKDGENKLVNVI